MAKTSGARQNGIQPSATGQNPHPGLYGATPKRGNTPQQSSQQASQQSSAQSHTTTTFTKSSSERTPRTAATAQSPLEAPKQSGQRTARISNGDRTRYLDKNMSCGFLCFTPCCLFAAPPCCCVC